MNLNESINEKKVKIKSFGCKVNSYDAGLIEKQFESTYLKTNKENPSVIVFNTCAVTKEATKEALREIRKAKKKNPEVKILVTGCSAQVDTESFLDHPDVDVIVANSHKSQIGEITKDLFNNNLDHKLFKSNIFKIEDLGHGGGQDSQHTRSFLKIQDGCNSFCTYCVIPFARGKSRSIPISNIVHKVNALYEEGVKEVVITGIHIGDYEDESLPLKKRYLGDLLKTLLLKTAMPRFRVSSLEPLELTDEILELYKDPRMCPHFHLSIQSLNDTVLKNMKRQYEKKDVLNVFQKINKNLPQAYIGMDVIVGFPGETQEQFEEVYESLKNLNWTKIHSFPYSERPGTFATRLNEKWPRSLIMERSKKLRELSQVREQEKLINQVGQNKNLLMLKPKNERQWGLSEDNWAVQIQSSQSFKPGEIYSFKVQGFNKNNQLFC